MTSTTKRPRCFSMVKNCQKWGHSHTSTRVSQRQQNMAKYGVLEALMFRFGERSSFGINFMDNVCNQIIKMIRFGYNAKKLLAIVKKFNKWNPSLGRSSRLKWAIIKRIKIWLIRNRRKATGRSRVWWIQKTFRINSKCQKKQLWRIKSTKKLKRSWICYVCHPRYNGDGQGE